MQIIVAQISISYIDEKLHSQCITKQNLIMHISDTQFLILSNNSIRPILSVKQPSYIDINDENISIYDDNKKIEYNITISNIIDRIIINDNILSLGNKSMKRQESNMKESILNNFNNYFSNSKILKEEYVTPYGNIDILAINKNGFYDIIELKKRSTDLNTIDQVIKYWKYFEESGKDVNLYVIWINNNNKNISYAKDHNVHIIEE